MAKIYDHTTKEWVQVSNANEIAIKDISESFQGAKNVEEALQVVAGDLATKDNNINEIVNTLSEHSEKIDWLMINGGGGGGTGSGGSSAPTLTSRIVEDSFIVDKGTDVILPVYFTSPNLGDGVLIVTVDDKDWDTYPIKQGSNNINIGVLPNLSNRVSVYAKDRVGLTSNPIDWTVICGGIDLTLDFDYNVDYNVGTPIYMPFNIYNPSKDPVTLIMNINGEEKRIPCVQGYNEYVFNDLNVGIHKVTLQATDGTFSSAKITFNLVVLNSDSLYLSSTFQNGTTVDYGVPIIIDYRISNPTDEVMTVNQYLDNQLQKTLQAKRGSYSWTLNNLTVKDNYKYKIEVINGKGETRELTGTFHVVQGDYSPVQINTQGLIYRLNASTRTNQDLDKENPVYEGIQATLHGFNFASDGWLDGVLKCNASSYVEIDYSPWGENAPNGSTVEILFKTKNIGEDKAKILNYTDTNTNKGFYIGYDEAKIGSVTNSSQVFLNADEWTTISFVLDRKNRFAKIFLNGICTRAFSLSDSGSGVDTILEDFVVNSKMYLNCDSNNNFSGSTEIKDLRIYRRALTDDEIVTNVIAQEEDLIKQKLLYDFNFENKTLPTIRMYGDTTNMTLENPVPLRIKYISPNTEKYGQPFDLPYCEVYWQGTSSLDYVLKNYNIKLKDEDKADTYYTPYPNGVPENLFCLKADYMESSHSRNVGIAKFMEHCMYDTKNPAQLKDNKVRNCVEGFPILLYINDELQGVYNFNTDRYSVKTYGYTDPNKHLVYEISANSDTTAGAFFKWTAESGKSEIDYYKSDFSCIYPPTRVAGNDNFSEIKRLVEWVDGASDEDFKDNLDQYFNREYLLRYYVFAMLFGAVDSLGKNMKLATWDGRIWYPQVYDADTTIGLDNTGFLKFDMDIEVGDEGVYNTTSSQLWSKVKLLLWEEVKVEYAKLRNGNLTLANIFKYIVDDQMEKIPATYYNRDMQTKYLNFGSSYLYALHGKGEKHIKYWLQGRLIYLDSLLGYNVSMSDYVTVRSSKLGQVYLDIQTFNPMYLTVRWRNTQDGSADQILRVKKGETTRFSFNMPTATDQEIRIYGGKHLKSVGDLTNLAPTTVLLAKAPNITELVCHSPNLINTDLSECTNLQKVDLSDCTQLGAGVSGQSIIDVSKCDNIQYINCKNTQVTAVHLNPTGTYLKEIWYPSSIQSISLNNCPSLNTLGLTRGHSCKDLRLTNCPNIQQFGDREYDNQSKNYKYPNASLLAGLQSLYLDNSYDVPSIEILANLNINNVTLKNLKHTKELTLGARQSIMENEDGSKFTYYPTNEKLEALGDFKLVIQNCPNLDTFNTKTGFMREHYEEYANLLKNPSFDSQAAKYKNYAYQSGFHCNICDLSETKLKNINLFITSYMNKLVLPTTMESFRVNPLSGTRHNTKAEINSRDSKKLYYDSYNSGSMYSYNGAWENECTAGSLIYSISSTLETCENNKWNMTDFILKDFELGIYCITGPRNNNRINVDPSHKLNIQGLNLVAHKYIPCFNTEWLQNVSGTIDYTNYTGDHLINAFSFTTDELVKIFPSNFEKFTYIDDMIKGMQSSTIKWSDPVVSMYYSYLTKDTEAFKNTVLAEQTSIEDGAIFYNDKIVPANAYATNMLVGSNLKYIKRWELPNATYLGYPFHGNTNTLVEVGEIIAPNCNSMPSLFTGQTALQKVGNITLASTGNINISSAFYNCSNLRSVGDINIRSNGTLNMQSVFSTCPNLQTVGSINTSDEANTNCGSIFNRCDNLESVDFLQIGTCESLYNGFVRCYALKRVKIKGKSLVNNQYLFFNTNTLEGLDLTEFEIGGKCDFLFQNSSVTGDVTLKGDLITALSYMFNNAPNVTSITINNPIEGSMSNFASGCAKLQNVTLTGDWSNVTNGNASFYNCPSLSTINGVTELPQKITDTSGMFRGCPSLTKMFEVTEQNTELIKAHYMYAGVNMNLIENKDYTFTFVNPLFNMENTYLISHDQNTGKEVNFTGLITTDFTKATKMTHVACFLIGVPYVKVIFPQELLVGATTTYMNTIIVSDMQVTGNNAHPRIKQITLDMSNANYPINYGAMTMSNDMKDTPIAMTGIDVSKLYITGDTYGFSHGWAGSTYFTTNPFVGKFPKTCSVSMGKAHFTSFDIWLDILTNNFQDISDLGVTRTITMTKNMCGEKDEYGNYRTLTDEQRDQLKAIATSKGYTLSI